MPEKPDTWMSLINNLPPAGAGGLMAIFIAILRVIYDDEETKWMRIILESMICGALAVTINSGVIAVGFGANWAVFIGGTVGYFGSAKVRAWAIKLINARVK